MIDLGGLLILFLDLLALISLMSGNTTVGHKVVWTLVIVLVPILGVLLYLLIGREPQDRRITNCHAETR